MHLKTWGAVLVLLVAACDDGGITAFDSQATLDGWDPDATVLPDGPAADTTADKGADTTAPDALIDALTTPDTAAPDGATPQDASLLAAAVTQEKWYQGGQTCKPASIQLTGQPGTVVVQLLQVPAADVPGTCTGHAATVAKAGSTLTLDLFGNTTSACWTACWDFELEINVVPPGTYTVSFKSVSGTVTVP